MPGVIATNDARFARVFVEAESVLRSGLVRKIDEDEDGGDLISCRFEVRQILADNGMSAEQFYDFLEKWEPTLLPYTVG